MASVVPVTRQMASIVPVTRQMASIVPVTRQMASVVPVTRQMASIVPVTRQMASVVPVMRQMDEGLEEKTIKFIPRDNLDLRPGEFPLNYPDEIEINDETRRTKAIFYGSDIVKLNILRRAIMTEIETYAIDIVIFQINTSSRHDEIIAHRLGQLVIDHENLPEIPDEFRTTIDVSGPEPFTSKNIPGLSFKYETPIEILRRGERIKCDVIVKRDKAKTHVKWRPIARITVKTIEEGDSLGFKETTLKAKEKGTILEFQNIGMLPSSEIIIRGIKSMISAASQPPSTLFSQPLIPRDINI